ncbi:ABC transporter permease [Frankia sp. Cpl3]|uniref:ABC transporter permease n=1 Tax=Parafrankia colletiae TaxID=573497 RepID=UPI0009FC065F|nr:ABC transporter permease [Parafrankia colletiae]MCK9898607.1 ABC transporter permease [Frankia sp. Cpl3]
MEIPPDARLALGLILLLALAFAALSWAGVGRRRDVVTASLRAAAQLAVIGLALRGVFAAPAATIAVLALMLTAAVATASRRLSGLPHAGRAVLASCVAGAALPLGITFATGAMEVSTRNLIALTGSVVGGTMTSCTLTGRRLADGLRQRRDEVEAWLALGATPRQACLDVARHSVSEALVPALDQTRTVGLVTLPGAFVGALFGGASPGEAARFQLVVLVGLLAAESVAAVTLARMLGAPTVLPTTPQGYQDTEASPAGRPEPEGPSDGHGARGEPDR